MNASASSEDRLAQIELLAAVPSEERVALAQECTFRNFAAGQIVFDKDSASREIIFVVRGKVDVTGFSLVGKEISFAEIAEGDYFGEIAAIDDEPRSATVVAITQVELAFLNPPQFHTILETYPEIHRRIMHRMCRTIRRSNERLMDFSTLSAHQRICKEVLKMAMPSQAVPGAYTIAALPTQAAISNRVGTTRETVARVLADLIKGGIITKKGRAVTIHDRAKLELLTLRLGDRD